MIVLETKQVLTLITDCQQCTFKMSPGLHGFVQYHVICIDFQ